MKIVVVSLFFATLILNDIFCVKNYNRLSRALQKEHEKPQEDKWEENFLVKEAQVSRSDSLVNLLQVISKNYLFNCATIFLHDKLSKTAYPYLLEKLLKKHPLEALIGQINENYELTNDQLIKSFSNKCVNYVLFVYDIMKCQHLIGVQYVNKVIIVSFSSQWRVHEFLSNHISHGFVNLLVVTQSDKVISEAEELPFILYTHELYSDGLGSSKPVVITSWMKSKLSRPKESLFPQKFDNGFSGHRFIISVVNQPPFVIKKRKKLDEEGFYWDGVEVKLIELLGSVFNFTTDFREATAADSQGQTEAVIEEIKLGKAYLGIGGIFVTDEIILIPAVTVSQPYMQDCLTFISLTSTALPRWRAIMGPFHWTVWFSLMIAYILAIFPLYYTNKHSLKYLFKHPEEMENMFWYVFGTFTNCFTFKGKYSWAQSHKYATRLLIGFYWLFTIIITSSYTGSIIAFVTLPVTPETTDSAKEIVTGHYQVGTLDKGIWPHWFKDSSDPLTKKLFNDIDLVPTLEEGLNNITKAFFWPYAFLGSKTQLAYLVQTTFKKNFKKTFLHIANECFLSFGVSIIFNKNVNYRNVIDKGLLRAVETGLLKKLTRDVEWKTIRSSTGKLLQASSGNLLKQKIKDKSLTLKDTEGMFLLLGFGVLLSVISLISEWFGGCYNICRKKRLSTASSLTNNPISYDEAKTRKTKNEFKETMSAIDIEARIDKLYDFSD